MPGFHGPLININAAEPVWSPIPYNFKWDNYFGNNIPVWQNPIVPGEMIAAGYSGQISEGAPIGFVVIRIRESGYCVFASANVIDRLRDTGTYWLTSRGLTFDGRIFTAMMTDPVYLQGFFRYLMPLDFVAGGLVSFPMPDITAIPANPCGINGDTQNLYNAGGEAIIEYIKNFPGDSAISANVVNDNQGQFYGFVLPGEPNPLFGPGISTDTISALVVNPPFNFSAGDISSCIMNNGIVYSLAVSLRTKLKKVFTGDCATSIVRITSETVNAFDLTAILPPNQDRNFCLHLNDRGYFYIDYSHNQIIGYSPNGLDYWGYILPVNIAGCIGGGYTGTKLMQMGNIQNSPLHVQFSDALTLPLPPTNAQTVTHSLINFSRPVSTTAKYKT